jgi:putative restriction endonuclease
VLEAWDRQCAFCGYDGQITGTSVAIEAAHVRWFAFDGPDALDNGLALCVLHHKLFDLGSVGTQPATAGHGLGHVLRPHPGRPRCL